MIKILVVEDDKAMNSTVCSYLSKSGFDVRGCLTAAEAYDAMYETTFDIIISDIMMPKINGFEFAENVRAIDKEIPILFMTGLDDIGSKTRGFKAGIDDYMTKPIELDELVLRVNALLRRARISAEKKLVIGGLTLDADTRTAVYNDEEISLTAREFNLLYKLLSYPKKTFTRSQLMDEFWNAESGSNSRSVDVYITKLRDKFKNCADFEIQTVHGLGYKAQVSQSETAHFSARK